MLSAQISEVAALSIAVASRVIAAVDPPGIEPGSVSRCVIPRLHAWLVCVQQRWEPFGASTTRSLSSWLAGLPYLPCAYAAPDTLDSLGSDGLGRVGLVDCVIVRNWGVLVEWASAIACGIILLPTSKPVEPSSPPVIGVPWRLDCTTQPQDTATAA